MQKRFSHGSAIIYLLTAMVVILALVSLGVDYGRVQLAKTELRAAADAACRAAASKLAAGGTDTEVRTEAVTWAGYNKVDGGQSVVLATNSTNQDVEIGAWDTSLTPPAFTTGSTTKNAVRITAHRSASRNNAVNLLFGTLIGQPTCDVTASAVATYQTYGYGMVGLDFILMKGNTISASSGSSSATSLGIASNGSISIIGSSSVTGDARPGVGSSVNGNSNVTGSTAPLAAPLVFPPGNAGNYATTNDNSQVPGSNVSGNSFNLGNNQNLTLPGGNYYFSDFSTGGGSSLTFTGPATIYCYGNFNMGGNAVTSSSLPQNLKIVMVPNNGTPPGSVTLGGTAALYAEFYAPQSPITVAGTGAIYGSMIGKSISMVGTSAVYYDSAWQNNGVIVLVK